MSRAGRTKARAPLLAAIVLGLAFVLVVVLRTPWDVLPEPPGGGSPVDPTGGLAPEDVERAESLAAALRPASLISLALSLTASGVLALTPLGARLVQFVGRPFGGRRTAQVLLGTAALVVVGRLVTLPFSAYGEMIRHRFGLSTRSWGLWVRDVLVSTGISALLTAVAVMSFLWLIRRAPRTWWAWSAATAAAFVVVGSFLYPLVIEPAFNRFESLPAGQLRTDLLDLAEENGTPVEDVLVSDASRRTTALNAYVSGFGSTRRIVVYDTVIERLPDDQIESIVAHELGHVATDDVLTGTLMGAIGAAAGVSALCWVLGSSRMLRRAGVESPADPRVIPLVLFLAAVGTLLSTPAQNLVSRHVEARADVRALDLTADPDAFIGMQRSLAATNLSDPDPPAAWHWFFGSHPTVSQRVTMARDWQRLAGP
ncbi:M48 family metallopeptidase [Blastococcus sp. PRF04-17]|uniref:M48 family metallopeptidase n=1 Tax=Blastococcus sp. PRF04-17 TaxID=2933797 RepID=UPI001FF31A08|nr:M48 family metallopeptidase [Blastococcus sp. PRF04-17]UOY02987.1 M48 family metallopeptidase [Blastococcus sp. PRF04-17]